MSQRITSRDEGARELAFMKIRRRNVREELMQVTITQDNLAREAPLFISLKRHRLSMSDWSRRRSKMGWV